MYEDKNLSVGFLVTPQERTGQVETRDLCLRSRVVHTNSVIKESSTPLAPTKYVLLFHFFAVTERSSFLCQTYLRSFFIYIHHLIKEIHS